MIQNINLFPFMHKARYEMDFGLVKEKLDNVLQECREGVEKYNIPILESGGGMSTAPVSSDFQAHLLPEFEGLNLFLQKIIDEVLPLWGINCNQMKYIDRSWCNIHPPGGVTVEHRHTGIMASAVYYLHKPKGSGDLLVRNPMEMYKCNDPIDAEQWDVFNWQNVEAETGDLLIFPGWLLHKTEINKSTEDRYVLTWNIRSEKCNALFR